MDLQKKKQQQTFLDGSVDHNSHRDYIVNRRSFTYCRLACGCGDPSAMKGKPPSPLRICLLESYVSAQRSFSTVFRSSTGGRLSEFCVQHCFENQQLETSWISYTAVLAGSLSPGGDIAVYVSDINQPSLPIPFLFCSCAYICLYGPFSCILFHTLSRQLSAFSLCSSGLISALLALSTKCLFSKVSFNPNIITHTRLMSFDRSNPEKLTDARAPLRA